MKITNFIVIMIFSIPCYSKIEIHMEMNNSGDLLVRIFDDGVCSEKILKDVIIAYLAKDYRLKKKRRGSGFFYLPTSFHLVLFKKIEGSYHWFNMSRLEHQRWTLKPNDEIVRVNNIGPANSKDVDYYYLGRLKSATWKGEDSPFQDISRS